MMKQRWISMALLAAACLPFAADTLAQAFPSRQITILVPFPPGGPTDQLARVVGQKISENTGQPIVVDNRPGGGAQIAAAALKQAPADGYTLMIGDIGALAINPTLYQTLSYDPVKDFAPIALMITMPLMLVVPQNVPAGSIRELVALASARPAGLNYASQGIGTGGHLVGEMFKAASKTNLVHVPFKGGAAALNEILAGRVDLLFDGQGGFLPHLRSGKLKPLAMASTKRSLLVPDLLTTAEQGYPDVAMNVWFGAVARAGTPPALIRKLNEEIALAMKKPDVLERFGAIGFEPAVNRPDEFERFMKDEILRWGAVVKASGARVD